MHEEDTVELLAKIIKLKKTDPDRYEEIMSMIEDEDIGGGHRSHSQLKSFLKDDELSENLKQIVRETYEAACMECGYEEGLEECGYEEEALEEYVAEAKKKKKNWIAQATAKHKGALRATAKRKGLVKGDEPLSQTDLEKLKGMGGKTAKRAALAQTLKGLKK